MEKVCPYCQLPVKPGAAEAVCPRCGVPHHAECWQANQGCTTFGCGGRAATSQNQPAPVAPTAPPLAATPPVGPGPTASGRSRKAWAFAGIAAVLVLATLVGLRGPHRPAVQQPAAFPPEQAATLQATDPGVAAHGPASPAPTRGAGAQPAVRAALNEDTGATSAAPMTEAEARQFVEEWRRAWSSKDLTTYRDCYDPHRFVGRNYSSHQGYKSMEYAAWMRDKQIKFGRAGSLTVEIGEPSVSTSGAQATVAFHQSYTSSSYHDEGSKTLTLARINGRIQIVGEDFHPNGQ